MAKNTPDASAQAEDDLRVLQSLTPTQQMQLLLAGRPTGYGWFARAWEGSLRATFLRSLMQRGLAAPREPGAQALTSEGRRLRASLLRVLQLQDTEE